MFKPNVPLDDHERAEIESAIHKICDFCYTQQDDCYGCPANQLQQIVFDCDWQTVDDDDEDDYDDDYDDNDDDDDDYE